MERTSGREEMQNTDLKPRPFWPARRGRWVVGIIIVPPSMPTSAQAWEISCHVDQTLMHQRNCRHQPVYPATPCLVERPASQSAAMSAAVKPSCADASLDGRLCKGRGQGRGSRKGSTRRKAVAALRPARVGAMRRVHIPSPRLRAPLWCCVPAGPPWRAARPRGTCGVWRKVRERQGVQGWARPGEKARRGPEATKAWAARVARDRRRPAPRALRLTCCRRCSGSAPGPSASGGAGQGKAQRTRGAREGASASEGLAAARAWHAQGLGPVGR